MTTITGQAEMIFQMFVSQQEKELLEKLRQQRLAQLDLQQSVELKNDLEAELKDKLKSVVEPRRVCTKCHLRKNTRISFYRNSTSMGGFNTMCKKCQDKRSKEYTKKHRLTIKEQDRQRRYKRMGMPIPPKHFSFYNDVIREWIREAPETSRSKFKKILALNLTDNQRTIVELAMRGYSVTEVAQKLGVIQPTITKAWNGQPNKDGTKIYGGIYKKYMRAYGEHLKIHGEIK